MQIIMCTLTAAETAVPLRQADASVIHDVLWAHAPRSLGLEHVTVIPARDRMRIALFLRQDTENPIPQVQSLLNRLRDRLPSGLEVLGARENLQTRVSGPLSSATASRAAPP